MPGWIKLYRKLLDSDMYKSLTSKQRDVLIAILLSVNFENKKWEWGGEVFECRPGQCITSLESILKKCAKEMKVQSVRTALLKLEKWGFLTNVSTKTGRLITILNWSEYQSESFDINKAANKDLTKLKQRANKELTPSKKDKEIKEGKEKEEGEQNELQSNSDNHCHSTPYFDNYKADQSRRSKDEQSEEGAGYLESGNVFIGSSSDSDTCIDKRHRNGVNLDWGHLNGCFGNNFINYDWSGSGIVNNLSNKNSEVSLDHGQDGNVFHFSNIVNNLDNRKTITGVGSKEAMGDENLKVVRKEVKYDNLGEKAENAPKQTPKRTEEKTTKNGNKLDLTSLESGFDTSVVEEFISYRKMVKKSALTQRALVGVCRNAKKTSETHGGSFSDALVYAMENNWLTPDPKYIDDNKQRYIAFLEDQRGPGKSDEKIKQERIEDLKRRAKLAQEKWDREHGATNA